MHGLVEKMVEDFVTAAPRLLGRQVSMGEVMYEIAGRMGFGEGLYLDNVTLSGWSVEPS
jgi:hypothetical protein